MVLQTDGVSSAGHISAKASCVNFRVYEGDCLMRASFCQGKLYRYKVPYNKMIYTFVFVLRVKDIRHKSEFVYEVRQTPQNITENLRLVLDRVQRFF